MKRLLLPLLAALALPNAVSAEVSDTVHNRCKEARDYAGCVKLMTKEKNEPMLNKKQKNNSNIFLSTEEELNIDLKKNPSDTATIIKRAKLRYIKNSNIIGALNDLKDVIRINPYEAEAFYLKAVINAIEYQKYQEALMDVDKAVDLDKTNSDYYLALGYLRYLDSSDIDKSLRDINLAINLDQDNSLAYFFKGIIHKERAFYESAVNDFSRSLESYENNINPLFKRLYPVGYKHIIFALRGATYTELGKSYYSEDKNKSEAYLNLAIDDLTSYIKEAPSMEDVEKLKNVAATFDHNFIKISGYYWRAVSHIWKRKKSRQNACKDLKIVYRKNKELLGTSLGVKYDTQDSPLNDGFFDYADRCR